MILKTISLENFRLHKNTSLNFSNHLNYIVGGNGQGKTSLLEAIYYLCTSKNLNRNSDNEAVSFEEKYFKVYGEFLSRINNKVEIRFENTSRKKVININDKPIYRTSQIIGKFPVVTLTQPDHAITLGAPADRRKFVDSVITQASTAYLKNLLEYGKILRQRAILLNLYKEKRTSQIENELSTWTEMLIRSGAEIVRHRIAFIVEFNEYLTSSYKEIINDLEEPSIEYEYLNMEKAVEETFIESLADYRDEEIRKGMNLFGPHRDEFSFRINGRELKKYGSQGQHKTFQISLRFGEFFYLSDKLGEAPLFLLDDVFGELDEFRARRISNYLKKIGQAFLTLTDITKFDSLTKTSEDFLINIASGKAVYA